LSLPQGRANLACKTHSRGRRARPSSLRGRPASSCLCALNGRWRATSAPLPTGPSLPYRSIESVTQKHLPYVLLS
jgi:hypothetical protein